MLSTHENLRGCSTLPRRTLGLLILSYCPLPKPHINPNHHKLHIYVHAHINLYPSTTHVGHRPKLGGDCIPCPTIRDPDIHQLCATFLAGNFDAALHNLEIKVAQSQSLGLLFLET